MPRKSKKLKTVHEGTSGPAEQERRMELAERKVERQILHDLIKAKIGLSNERAIALQKIYSNPPANITEEELQQNNRQRLEGMAEMALLRLNHAKSGPLHSLLGLSTATKPLPEPAIEPSSQRDPDAGLENHETYEVYRAFGFPEGKGYTKAFPKDKEACE